jgi:hypothetical protein
MAKKNAPPPPPSVGAEAGTASADVAPGAAAQVLSVVVHALVLAYDT